MGQIIDLHQRRPGAPRTLGAAVVPARPDAWPGATASYGEAMLAPFALWRSLLASYAAWWLAPFGLEVRPIPPPGEREAAVRATGGR